LLESGSKLLAEYLVIFNIILPALVNRTPTLLAWNWLLPTMQCNPLQFWMDRQVAMPLFYPSASENETEYENVKFEGRLYTTLRDDTVGRMTYPLLNKQPSFKL
jgi:hypothetical protein